MDKSTDILMQAIIFRNTESLRLVGEINVNKICQNGMTLLGAAAQTGNLPLLKRLIERHYSKWSSSSDTHGCSKTKPPYDLELDCSDNPQKKKCKNIGYFVVYRDADDNEFGDGPTPEGMEGLEWDMEVKEAQLLQGNANDISENERRSDDTTENDDGMIRLYKWYASILNKTSYMLESPDRDLGRLDKHGLSVLHYAVRSQNTDMVGYLLDKFKIELNVNQTDENSSTPLHMATSNEDINMVKFLVKRRANVNTTGGRERNTPLHIAVKNENIQLIRCLVEAGADVNAMDKDSRSVLCLAAKQGNGDDVKFLIAKGAKVNHEDRWGITPLRYAVMANHPFVVHTLLAAGARQIASHHLLHTAATNNNIFAVQHLVNAGAPLNARDDKGYTAMMYACSRKNDLIVEYLLNCGADPNAVSHIDGKTALHVCVQDVRTTGSIWDLIDMLVNKGANMNAPSYQGNVLFYSIISGNKHATSALIQHGADVNFRDDKAYVDNLSLAKRYGDLHLVKLLVYAGFKISQMSWDPKALRTTCQDASCDFLVAVKTNPLSLRELCRIEVRSHIGPPRLILRIKQLPLPPILHKYLALDILE